VSEGNWEVTVVCNVRAVRQRGACERDGASCGDDDGICSDCGNVRVYRLKVLRYLCLLWL
jgi:hypothetical protein